MDESPYDKPCDYEDCDKPAIRHFFFHHFCNQHNKHLREKIAQEQPDNLEKFLDNHTD